MNYFDVVIIGGGPAGYAGALRAAGQKARVALIEKDKVGGTCLNRGCIPTKCYCHSTKTYSKLKKGKLPEIVVSGLELNYGKMLERKDEVVSGLRRGLTDLMKKMKISIIKGTARIKANNEVLITDGEKRGETLKAEMILIATGSEPGTLPFIPDDSRIHTTDSVWDIKRVPEKLLIIGGGVIGIEAASIYASLCNKVTVVEILPEILTNVNRSLKRVVAKNLKEKGVELLLKKRVTEIAADKDLSVKIEGEDEAKKYDGILVAVGRKPVLKDLFDESINLELKDGFIKVGIDMQTTVKGIYAAGDVIGMPMLAHSASREAIVAVNRGLGFDKEDKMDPSLVPDVVFSDPEIAQIGFIPDSAAKRDENILVGRFPYITASKAMCEGEKEGFAEIVYDKSKNKIVGGAIVGSGASDLIGEVLLAVYGGLSPETVEKSIHPHPTMTEIIWEATADTLGKALYKIRKN